VAELDRQTAALIRKKANVAVQEHTIQKSDAPERMRIEVEKTIRAYEIGWSTGLFRVPRVLDHDECRGVAVFEKLGHLQSIRQQLTFGSDYRGLAERMARSLAAIHNLLELPESMSIPLPRELRHEGRDVFIHGDFSFNNVCIDLDDGALVILDWQMTKIHGGNATHGTRYFDMAWFLSNLFNRRLHHCPFAHSASETAMLFLRTYAQAARTALDIEDYRDYLERFVTKMKHRRRKQWSLARRMMLAANRYYWQQYVRRLLDCDSLAS
jgi:hypothetical protein